MREGLWLLDALFGRRLKALYCKYRQQLVQMLWLRGRVQIDKIWSTGCWVLLTFRQITRREHVCVCVCVFVCMQAALISDRWSVIEIDLLCLMFSLFLESLWSLHTKQFENNSYNLQLWSHKHNILFFWGFFVWLCFRFPLFCVRMQVKNMRVPTSRASGSVSGFADEVWGFSTWPTQATERSEWLDVDTRKRKANTWKYTGFTHTSMHIHEITYVQTLWTYTHTHKHELTYKCAYTKTHRHV